jgi:hypothetical protein
VQAMALGELKSLTELRQVVRSSFDLRVYKPIDTDSWNEAFKTFLKVTHLEQ